MGRLFFSWRVYSVTIALVSAVMLAVSAQPAAARWRGAIPDARGVARLADRLEGRQADWRYDTRGRAVGAVRRGPNSILFYDRRGNVTRAIRLFPARGAQDRRHGEPLLLSDERARDGRDGLFGRGSMGPGWKRLDFGRFAGGVGVQ